MIQLNVYNHDISATVWAMIIYIFSISCDTPVGIHGGMSTA